MKLHIYNPADPSVGIMSWWATVELGFEPDDEYTADIVETLREAFTEIADFRVQVYTDAELQRIRD